MKDNVAIYYVNKLNGSNPKWFQFCSQAYTQFFDPEFNTFKLHSKCGFVIAVNAETEEPVACIIYDPKSDDEWYIIKSFTIENARGNGFNGMLFSELANQAQKKGITSITSNVNPANEYMIKALEKSDRKVISYVTEFKVEQG